jgi:ketosteroid isomerase-like protein
VILGFWAEDGRYIKPDVEMNDKPALASWIKDAFSRSRTTSLDLSTDEVFVHDNGTVAYQLGNYTERIVPKSAGSAVTHRSHYIARWKKNAAGEWLLDHLYATPMPPVRN